MQSSRLQHCFLPAAADDRSLITEPPPTAPIRAPRMDAATTTQSSDSGPQQQTDPSTPREAPLQRSYSGLLHYRSISRTLPFLHLTCAQCFSMSFLMTEVNFSTVSYYDTMGLVALSCYWAGVFAHRNTDESRAGWRPCALLILKTLLQAINQERSLDPFPSTVHILCRQVCPCGRYCIAVTVCD